MRDLVDVGTKQIDINTVTCEINESDTDDPGSTKPPLFLDNWGVNKKKIDDWNDWKWQLKNSIRSIDDLKNTLAIKNLLIGKSIAFSNKTIEAAKIFPLNITPYYFSLIKEYSYNDPIFKICVPNEKELINPNFLSNDPLSEEHDTVVPNLVHRYKDRALLVSTNKCYMNCRFCVRKRVSGSKDFHLTDEELDNAVNYIRNHSEIKDVIISGGDPFTMSTAKLEKILHKLRSINTLDIIRIGTKTPAVLPMRITNDLVNMISNYHPIWINTHFSHPNELTEDAKDACAKMSNRGIPLNNQCVLLKGINDDVNTMADLFKRLLKIRIKPYYMFQCDLVNGAEHFRTPISKGLEIMEYLRGRISGLGIPHFIVDSPEGKGKISLLPNCIIKQDKDRTILRNYKNEMISYPEPIGREIG